MAQNQTSPEDRKISRGEPRPKTDAGESSTKQAVYEAAIRLFARNGFAATGMRELSREAGVNLATVNYFYGSKKGLLKAILDDYFAGLKIVLTENLPGDDAPEVKLRRTITALARYFAANSDKLIVAFTELPHDDPDITDFKAQRFKRVLNFVRRNVGESASHLSFAVIGPAMVGLAASRFLFNPVLEIALPPETRARESDAYPELIAELFINGAAGLLAAQPKCTAGGDNG